MSTHPNSPEELLRALFSIFPNFRTMYSAPQNDVGSSVEPVATYHSIMAEFTPTFVAQRVAAAQLAKFGELVNFAVSQGGALENAFATCFLEHLVQIGAEDILGPYLSREALEKSHP
jgi:hypothetical protein